ncbi:MAG: O-methyltransferase [Candidatus Thermoplasmatota archaeon]
MKPFTDAAVMGYLHEQQPSNHPILLEMEERTARDGFPIIGPLVGRTCALLARSVGARTVYEMGSGFGYSTFWFARAVGAEGRVLHTEGSRERSVEARAYLERAGLADRVAFKVGDGLDLAAAEPGLADVVFIDVDKHQYPAAWRIACEKVRVGGLILTDNTLWSGKVADVKVNDRDTVGARTYNELALADPRFLTTILPLRDGLSVSLRLA